MGKNRKSSSVGGGKKRKGILRVESCVSDVEGDSNGSDSPDKGKGSRNGTIRHVYTTNSDMDCIEEYLKPVYKDGEVILEVECGSNKAMMYLSKLCQGSKGPCVEFQGSWLTPNEFQYVSGRETAKDWKRSIRHQGKSMKLLLTKGVLSVHSTVCDCEGCRVTSPVNRCRLAEKRRSVYSANRKERLTIESFTSCGASSLDGISDILDKPSEENVAIPITESKDIVSEKKISSKHCSPLRESRLSNIIEQLRSSKEREKSADSTALKQDFYEDEKRTRDENGNEGDDDTDCELSVTLAVIEKKIDEVTEPLSLESEDSLPDKEPISTERDSISPERETLSPERESLSPERESLSPEKELPLSDVPGMILEEPQAVKAEDKELEPIEEEKGSVIVDNETPEPSLETQKEISDVTQEKHNRVGSTEKITIEEKGAALEKTSLDHVNSSPKPASVEASLIEPSTKSKEETVKPFEPTEPTEPAAIVPEVQSAEVREESLKPSKPALCKKERPKSPIAPTQSIIRKERRQEKESKARCPSVKKSSPAAPTQSYSPAVSSYLTALPASVPEQLFTGDVNGAKYSDFIRLLAASHLGGHLPLVPDRLMSENLQGYPMAPNFTGLPHPFPSYPFFPHPVHMKDTSHFQVPPLSMPPAFIPHYMYRPFGLFPQAFVDPTSPSLTPPVEIQKPTVKESPAATTNRKRVSSSSEPDSALDLSTKRSKLTEESAPRMNNYHSKKSNPKKTGTIRLENGALNLGKSSRVNDRHGLSLSDTVNARHGLSFSDTTSVLDSFRRHSFHSDCSCHSPKKEDIRLWSVSEVVKFLQTLDGCYIYANTFREHRVDGKSLPLLTVEHLMHNIGMKLGPAVLLTKTVAKRLKLAKQAHKKCPKCDNAVSEMKSLQNYKLMSGQIV